MSTEEDQQNDDTPIEHKKVSYLWKSFQVNNRSLNQMIDEHEYVTNPKKSINYQFFLFHMVSYYI